MQSDDVELIEFILHTMRYYGSDAGERKNPGSKLRSQAQHIADFVFQRSEAHRLLELHKIDLVTIRMR